LEELADVFKVSLAFCNIGELLYIFFFPEKGDVIVRKRQIYPVRRQIKIYYTYSLYLEGI